MDAEAWMVRGYLAGFKNEPFEQPNEPIAQEAYRHGWRNGEDDRAGKPRDTYANLKAIADNIIYADSVSNGQVSSTAASATDAESAAPDKAPR